MNVKFSARHFEASDKLKNFAIEEVNRLKKYVENITSIDIVLDEAGSLKTAEIRVNVLGKVITSKGEDTDFYKMLPKVVDKLETQIRTAKDKAKGR